jgi:hypothetical protein
MILEFDEELVDDIVACDTPQEIRAIDGLDEDDADILVAANGHEDLARVFAMTDDDAETLLAMSDELELLGEAEYSVQRHEFLLRRMFALAKDVGGIAATLDDREAAEEVVRYINSEKAGSPETNKDYRTAVRIFGGLLSPGDTDEKPESIDWIPGGYPSNYDPAPDPSDMFRWDDHIKPMLDACNNSRDRALIAMAWDLGPRPGELYDLTIGRFTEHKYGLKVTLERGKQGTRSPLLIPSAPYVRDWREDHPADDDPTAPLWSRTTACEEITNQRIRDIVREKAEQADMTPPSAPTPSQLRKSSASYLASQGVSQAHLEDHHGWRRGSDIASRYITVFGEAQDREIAKAHGREVEEADETDALAPIQCPHCGQETASDRAACMHCGGVLDQEKLELVEEIVDMLDDRAVELEDPEKRREALSARRTIEEKPGVMDTEKLHQFASSLSSDD